MASTEYKYIQRFDHTKKRKNAGRGFHESRTLGYTVVIRLAGDPPIRCSKLFSDRKLGSRKAALIAAIRFRNKFIRSHDMQPVK